MDGKKRGCEARVVVCLSMSVMEGLSEVEKLDLPVMPGIDDGDGDLLGGAATS